MLYNPHMSPVALVRQEARAVNLTPDEFLSSKCRAATLGKRRLCYHLHRERMMPLRDVAHWMDSSHANVAYYVRRHEQLELESE